MNSVTKGDIVTVDNDTTKTAIITAVSEDGQTVYYRSYECAFFCGTSNVKNVVKVG